MSNILADVAAFANPYGTPSQGQWNLKRGIFTQNSPDGKVPIPNASNSVVFFYEDKDPDPTQHTAVDQLDDAGGRRLVKYEYPYVDGQRLSDLGRRGETQTYNIKFFGLNYQTLFNEFLNIVVNFSGSGTIIHPVRGALTVRFSDYQFIHRHDEWNAITIKAVFFEDNTTALTSVQNQTASQDSALRSALQFLTTTQATISSDLTSVSALLLLPAAISSAMQTRLTSITGQVSQLLGQLAATFSTNTQLQNLAAQANGLTGGVTAVTSGTVVNSNTMAQLPPVYQVGFDPTTQAAISTQLSNFINSNQVSPQQAVYNTNQARSAISAAITEVNTNLGNQGYDIMVAYRGLAVSIQQATESAISTEQSLVVIYTVPTPMSLRLIAQANGLPPEQQNVIEALNPYLGSVNYVLPGTQVVVPATASAVA